MLRKALHALCHILCVCSLILPLATVGQKHGALPRIGVLWPTSDNAELEAFRQGLHKLEYVERENIVLEYRYARGKDELLPDLAAELVGIKVDIILTWG